MRYKSYGKGWHSESYRHSLASKGIKTTKRHSFVAAAIGANMIAGSIEQHEKRVTQRRGYLQAHSLESQRHRDVMEEQGYDMRNPLQKSIAYVFTDEGFDGVKTSMAWKETRALQKLAKDAKSEFKKDFGEEYGRRLRGSKEQLLTDMQNDYKKRMLERKQLKFGEPKREFVEEEDYAGDVEKETVWKKDWKEQDVPKRLKLAELDKLRKDIDELHKELNPKVAKQERKAKELSEEEFPEEFKQEKTNIYYRPSLKEIALKVESKVTGKKEKEVEWEITPEQRAEKKELIKRMREAQ